MANHAFTQFSYSLEAKKVTLYAAIKFGVSGAPTLQQWVPPLPPQTTGTYVAAVGAGGGMPGGFGGVAKVVRNSAGDFTLTLQESYQRLLGIRSVFTNTKALGVAAPDMVVASDGTDVAGAKTIEVVFEQAQMPASTVAGTPIVNAPTDPASGELVILTIELSDSTAI
jgi:hypothetical protein